MRKATWLMQLREQDMCAHLCQVGSEGSGGSNLKSSLRVGQSAYSSMASVDTTCTQFWSEFGQCLTHVQPG